MNKKKKKKKKKSQINYRYSRNTCNVILHTNKSKNHLIFLWHKFKKQRNKIIFISDDLFSIGLEYHVIVRDYLTIF